MVCKKGSSAHTAGESSLSGSAKLFAVISQDGIVGDFVLEIKTDQLELGVLKYMEVDCGSIKIHVYFHNKISQKKLCIMFISYQEKNIIRYKIPLFLVRALGTVRHRVHHMLHAKSDKL